MSAPLGPKPLLAGMLLKEAGIDGLIVGALQLHPGVRALSLGATTVGSAIETLPSGQSWTDVVDAGAVILAVASDGRIYSIKDIAGTFTAKGTTELKGEVATCITETQGKIFYGTKV